MKTYKDFERRHIGDSDISSLTIRGITSDGLTVKLLEFAGDDSYKAYIVNADKTTEDVEIGNHYQLIYDGTSWIHIIDDSEITFKAYADTIRIYRSGDYGCIIYLSGNVDIKKIYPY